jgi:hypothetical protein
MIVDSVVDSCSRSYPGEGGVPSCCRWLVHVSKQSSFCGSIFEICDRVGQRLYR